MTDLRFFIGCCGFLITSYLVRRGVVPSAATLSIMVFAVFVISLCFRVFYRFFMNLWGRPFCISIYLVILVYAAIVISYGRIELNAHLITGFGKLLGAGIIILGPTDTLINHMMPSESVDSANSSSGSGNWRDFLNPSPQQGEAPSGLDQKLQDSIKDKVREERGDLAKDQKIDQLQEVVKEDLDAGGKAGSFCVIKQIEKEQEEKDLTNRPATNSIFNEIKEASSKNQDGKGGHPGPSASG
ncbi:hypothetical protein LI410_mgp029 (mitochondrion) [Apium graveolens]|uniref:hypothetical protein n=1 Tax=Apium graveolens TaxID=4045 RepID=UPI001D01C3B2|nr:hypothetical protein LI410_mgp029 [Apium graveolens]QVJ97954.1 hypothetical protein [Apium graveolens]